MSDPRVDLLARTLIRYSTSLGSGESIMIVASELAQPLALAAYREAIRVGAHAVLWPRFDDAGRIFLVEANDAQLRHVSPITRFAIEHVDAYLSIVAPANLKSLTNVEPRRQMLAGQAYAELRDLILKKKWVVCYFPSHALAQEAGMSLEEYAEFVFASTNVDWPATREFLSRWKAELEAGSTIRVVGPDTDISLGVAGRTWIPDDGHHNMPGGEVFTAPIEDSVNGYISYDYPAIHDGHEVDGIRLEFRDGQIDRATARTGEDYLLHMLDADAGARRLGELGIGTNYGITRFTKSILFDEKIGGTIHLAIGRAYIESGGTNQSSVHWDMIKDLRRGGEIYLDGRLIQRNGEFVGP